MEEGLKTMLTLHTPNELSSICGQLGLRILQKASVSIAQIMNYMENSHKDKIITMEIAEKVLGTFWETPILEYLRSTGHPVHPLSKIDPRKSVLTLWVEGGFISAVGSSDFVPHFIVREVKKRYALSTLSKDIVSTLEKIGLQQEKVKRAEQSIMVDRDYRHVLRYLKELGDLRAMENKLRDVLVSELDIARAEKDSADETMGIVTQQLGEVEVQFVRVAEALNARLADAECLCEGLLRERLKAESELQRLGRVVQSYIDADKDRSRRGGGARQALCMYQASEECNQEIAHLHVALRSYRDMRDDRDDALRQRVRSQADEIADLRTEIRRLHEAHEEHARVAGQLQSLTAHRLDAMTRHAQHLGEVVECKKVLVREAYASALCHAAVASEAQGSRTRATAVLLQEMARMVHEAAEEVRHAEAMAAAAAARHAVEVSPADPDPLQGGGPASGSPANSTRNPPSRPTSPAPAKTKAKATIADKSRPTTPAAGKGAARATSPSPQEPAPEAPASVTPAPVFVPPIHLTSLCHRLGTALGVASQPSFLALREDDERLRMADEDRVARDTAARERRAREAAEALAAEEAAAKAALRAKATKGAKASAVSSSSAAAVTATATVTAGRAVSPAPKTAVGDKKGAAPVGKKGKAAGTSPSPATAAAAAAPTTAGKDKPRSVSPAPKKPPAKK